MDAKEHQFFFDGIKRFNTFKSYCAEMAAGMQSLEAKMVHYDNAINSLESRVKAKEQELADIEQRIKERKMHLVANHDGIAGQLNAKHLALLERESKIALKEQMIAETQAKANKLLAAVEGKAGKKFAAV